MSGHAELLPCPFCGNTALFVNAGAGHIIRCQHHSHDGGLVEIWAETEELATERWNRRAAPPAGWVTVPAEPTEKMLDAGASAHLYKTSTLWYGGQGADIYRAMLAAAEKP